MAWRDTTRDIIRRVVRKRPEYIVESLPNRHTIDSIVSNLPSSYTYRVESITVRQREQWHRIWALAPRVKSTSPRLGGLYAMDLHFLLHKDLLRGLIAEGRGPEWYKPHQPWVIEATFTDLLGLDVESLEFVAHLIDRLSRSQGFGNVNHRTAIYLAQVLSAFALMRRGRVVPPEAPRFDADIDHFIGQSKKILNALEGVHAPRVTLLKKHYEQALALARKSRQVQSMARTSDSRAALEAFITDWGTLTRG